MKLSVELTTFIVCESGGAGRVLREVMCICAGCGGGADDVT